MLPCDGNDGRVMFVRARPLRMVCERQCIHPLLRECQRSEEPFSVLLGEPSAPYAVRLGIVRVYDGRFIVRYLTWH